MKTLSFLFGLFIGTNLGILIACILSATKIKQRDDYIASLLADTEKQINAWHCQ